MFTFRLIQRSRNLNQVYARGLKSKRSTDGKGTLEEVKANSDQVTHDNVIKALEDAEEADPSVTSFSFRGTQFHMSHKDPNETEPILSVRLYSDAEGSDAKHIETLHIRKDGTYKSNRPEKESNKSEKEKK